MKYVNREALRREMFAKKKSVTGLSKDLGISRQSFYYKLNCRSEFSEEELVLLQKFFGNVIFFGYQCCQTDDKRGESNDN